MKLKSCPFCGGSVLKITKQSTFDHVVKSVPGSNGLVSVRCDMCDCETNYYGVAGDTYKKAVMKALKKWNRRHYDTDSYATKISFE